MNKERDNLQLRTNILIMWAVLTLQEMSLHSTKVFETLDDWIVIATK